MSGGKKAEAKKVQNTAMSNLPVLNVNRIIMTVAEVASGKKDAKAAAIDLSRPYQTFAKEFAKEKQVSFCEMREKQFPLDLEAFQMGTRFGR